MPWLVTALVKQSQRRSLVTGHRRVNSLPLLLLQIFNEEYAVLYLDQGGALVAIRHTPLPIRHLWWVRAQPFVTCIISSQPTLVWQTEISLRTKFLLILSYKQRCINIWGLLSSLLFFSVIIFCHESVQINVTRPKLSFLFSFILLKAAYIPTIMRASILRVLSNSIRSIFLLLIVFFLTKQLKKWFRAIVK